MRLGTRLAARRLTSCLAAGLAAGGGPVAATGAGADDARPALTCFGAEPSWSLALGPDEATMTAPDLPQIDYTIPDEKRAEGRVWPRALTLVAPRDAAILILRPAACDDGLSDRRHGWTADMLTQRGGAAVILTGCCRAAPAE